MNYATQNFDGARGLITYQPPGISGFVWHNAISDLPPQDPHLFIDILNKPNATKEEIEAALKQAGEMLTEYNRQVAEHQGKGDETNAAIAQLRADGVTDAATQLAARYEVMVTGGGSGSESGAGNGSTGQDPKDTDAPAAGMSSGMKWGIGITLTLLAVAGGIVAYNKYGK